MDRARNDLHYPNMNRIPVYALYGEQVAKEDWLHWETIQSRSRLHGYRIAPHRHEQFFQVLHLTHGWAGVTLDDGRFDISGQGVVVVPALRIIYPALTGQLTLTLLGSSMASAISATELTLAAAKIESQTFRSLETFLVAAAIYIALTFVFRLIYWAIGLWLFRRKGAPAPSLAAQPGQQVEVGL